MGGKGQTDGSDTGQTEAIGGGLRRQRSGQRSRSRTTDIRVQSDADCRAKTKQTDEAEGMDRRARGGAEERDWRARGGAEERDWRARGGAEGRNWRARERQSGEVSESRVGNEHRNGTRGGKKARGGGREGAAAPECKRDAGRQEGGANQRGGGRRSSNRNGELTGQEISRIRFDENRGGRGGDRKDGMVDRKGFGKSSFTGRAEAPQGPRLGYKKLEELSSEDPSIVAITLSSHPALQDVLSETAMRKDLVELLCQVLSKAFTSQTDRATLLHLANIIKDSCFFRNVLPYYLAGMESEFNPGRRAQYPQQMGNILVVLSQVLSMYPASSFQAVRLLQTQLQASINSLKTSGVEIMPQIEESMEHLLILLRHLQERTREGTLRSDRDTYALLPTRGAIPGEEEQQDFRTIPIYPTPEEFHEDQRPFLRPNLTSQRYTNTQIYLDTHFRLLREDFVRPLRDGIQQLLWKQMNMGGRDTLLKTKHFDDIRIYFDTQLVFPICTTTGIAYLVQFDINPLKFVRWENSKRLIYGSLVCLSCDNFESFLFATVSDRDPEQLKKGRVKIIFTKESRVKLARIQKEQRFLMVETTAYFEAYRHVLEGLQELEEDNLPFQRYIVECNRDVQPPAYLQRGDLYNLNCIADPEYKEKLLPFHSLEEAAWPKMEELGLDESQMKAFQLALTKELAIIQGPPGTGKTYVGLKIAQALLTKEDLWSDVRAPMLVVCYTNHALDQFLEGIHKFLKNGIVRVGGRSDSEVLKGFNLRQLTCLPTFKRLIPGGLSNAYNGVYRQLCDMEREILSQTKMLEVSLKGVLREHILINFMSVRHWQDLHQSPELEGFEFCYDNKPNLIIEWLGLGQTTFWMKETEDATGIEEMAAEENTVLEEEGLIEIIEEAALIQAERIVEDSIDLEMDGDGRKKRDMKEDVKEIEEMLLAFNLDREVTQNKESRDGFEMQPEQKKKMKKKIRKELKDTSVMTEEEEDAVENIWTLSLQDRWRLYRLWVARCREDAHTRILESEHEYQNTAERLADIKRHKDLCVLRSAKVIGMTTTGAAKYRNILQQVGPPVVIVEEAAEVLEAHTITTLSRACQHLILIGDHQQLRPSATVYDLAKNFNLEISMFERLVKTELPYVRLNYQHRMRPEIAQLLTPHIYSELNNHPSVLDYDSIKGLNTNLFFVEHNHPEEAIRDGKSHQNIHEANFVVALCRYLLFQDYKPEQITILTTYTGQLHCLRKLMPAKQFTGVKVHVVDKYQGEENDIVLLSLVRSNPQGKVGFLNISNRVCVALSRARKGLYCICNSAMLGQIDLWSNIFCTLRQKNQIGNALILCCQNHPNRQVKTSCAEDFKQAPEGGCTQPCEFRLDCGHVCASVCHPYDPEHQKYKCAKQCQKILCDLGHKCPFVCHRPCPEECTVRIEKIIPQCQHKQMVPCHQDPETFICHVPCQKMLDCGHPCDALCGEPCTSKCKVEVTLKLRCGHSQKDACFYNTEPEDPECRNPCEHQLICGHTCQGTCGRCYQGRFHVPCSHQCERLLICSHKCREPCTRNCPPCKRPCENRCIHSKCMKPCGQLCVPCTEPCAWQCPHQSCTKLCHQPCDRPPCIQPCTKILKCYHPCIGLCGDQCPTKCRVCNHDEVTEIFFGTEDDPEAYFIQLEDCGHIVEHTAMDTYMNMDDNHQENEEAMAIKLKECPKCRTPIRKNRRYGSHINRCLAEIEMVKMKINGNQMDIKEHRKTLKKQWEDNLLTYGVDLQKEYMDIGDQLGKKHLIANDLWDLEHKIDLSVGVAKLKQIQREKMLLTDSFTLKAFKQFSSWLGSYYQRFTDQKVFDLQRELQRLILLTEFGARCEMADKRGEREKIQSEVQMIREILEKIGQFTEQDQDRVEDAMKQLDSKLPPTGLGITEEERKMIVSTMNLQLGHWYKCPNGHVYVITECGGAMESRKCPDCDATIGGSSHRLTSGNEVATEMDGAQHAAWSENNNILNFALRF